MAGLGLQLQHMVSQQALAATCGTQAACPSSSGPLSNNLASNSIAQSADASSSTPAAGVGISNVPMPQVTAGSSGQPCHDTTIFVANITNWTTPPGCYAKIFTPDQSKYYSPTSFGFCNWWVEALHTKNPDILMNSKYARGTKPVVGAAMWFDPGVQGASSAGHWAQVVAISPAGYWMLVTEMNFGWRGGGFGRVDYRYVHTGPGIQYVYTPSQKP